MNFAGGELLSDGGSFTETWGGVFSLPLGPGGDPSEGESGTATIDAVVEAEGPLRTLLVDGEIAFSFEDGTTVELTFTSVPVGESGV